MSKVHIFYDSSNIWGCGQATAKDIEPHVPWQAFRLYFKNLFAAVTQGRRTGIKVLGGSIPPENMGIWQYARDQGFDTSLLRRVEKDDGRIGEQAVDEVLHKRILETIIDCPSSDTLLLMTGDGRIAEFGDGFIAQCERALKLGWNVEVWGWKAGRHGGYERLQKKNAGITLHDLDPLYYSITYVQEGQYLQTSDTGAPYYTSLAGRVVSPLPRNFNP